MILCNMIVSVFVLIFSFFVLRFISKTSFFYLVKKWWQGFGDRFCVYQYYKVPQFNDHMQENRLYRKVQSYLNSLPSVEDSDFTHLFSGNKSNEINLQLDSNQTVIDTFLGARFHWIHETCEKTARVNSLILKVKKSDKRRILRPYLQHIHDTYDEIELRRKEVRLFVNVNNGTDKNGRWKSVALTHPSTMETVLMETDLKNKVKSDMEMFLKSKQYYHRLGRAWKRSYLLYGPSGTGKSTFISAMARFLSYDVYDVDLYNFADDSDLKLLLLQTTNKSLIVIEDLDRYLDERSTVGNVSLSGILNFMDGILSCCGEERVMVFTMNGKDRIDPTVLRPGRIDVHIHFPLCDFSAFKSLANSHLGLKDHKLFPQVEEMFQTGASLSPAEIGEIMISNRGSPSRALKSVITALQSNGDGRRTAKVAGPRLSDSGSVRVVEECGDSGMFCRENSGNSLKDIRKLYGLLRIRSSSSSRKESLDMDLAEKENSRHEN